MSKVDDELTRRLHGAERPVDVDAVFKGLERRRSHRERVRRAQTALLAITVLAATVGGFAVLSHAFPEQPRRGGSAPPPSPTPDSEGRDIGLGYPLCNVEELGGIDWYGDGTTGSAWTGAREREDGGCPRQGSGEYVVAADLDGDGAAEPGGMGFLQSCLFCQPYATTDLDDDGVLELVVIEEASSTVAYSFYAVSVPTSERSPRIYNLFVAPPGHPGGHVRSGEPLRIDSGGDEGYSSQIRCWNGPEGRELGWAWSLEPVDTGGRKQVHVLRIQLHADGQFHVVGAEEYSVPAGEPSGLEPPPGPTCGVDWNP